MKFIPAGSQVLQRRDGYRQLFMLYSLLQLASRCDFLATDFQDLIEIKDLPTLYEYWCFFQIRTVLDSLAEVHKISSIVHTTPLRQELSSGLCIEYSGGIRLYFNRTYAGSRGVATATELQDYTSAGVSYSHNLRPDIILTLGKSKLIFDAKYKGRKSGLYGDEQEGTITSWKEEDIDKMHCYRDAIRGVQGSFILYPGSADVVYPCCGSTQLCNGVGAVALRPELNTDSRTDNQELLFEIIASFLLTR
jgi:predicted component of viral defense system (DUF524 family)